MLRRSLLTASLSLPFAQRVLAQSDWPTRNVRIVCPFTPGGSQDLIARRLGAKLTDQLGQSFIVDNRSGAGGSIAADNVAKSNPDGYSVLLGNIGSHALVPHIYAKPPYNAVTDLETACWIGTQPNLLACHPSFPHDTPQKLIAAAKAEPGKYSYGSSGVGTSPSLTMELVKQKTGADLTFISYRGASAAAADVLSGQIPMVIANIDSLMGQVNAGKLKPIASTGAQRSGAAPDTPTFAESGFPDLVVTSWSLWAVPARTPAAIKEKLRLGTERALTEADVIESMKVGGFEPGTLSVAEADAFIKTEYQRWGEVIRAAGIKPQ
ncbi:MAG: tripartite tricarboxylate transporter substrate binding protein [Reyranella sp.]|uniref:Bug family tripartite tricarboxylate transporter substrate binding protein n=1 Tax=Reyranella sp. TaxID=1929291 RepID=UPI001AC636AC|nr:tripartite tricarboxylate transporter substrate binding protein [Reyranella sp.]MBN9085975.1 tripartite tricarboxylate transporter substrate binding protein [Reyranella sp.]